jgi:23S rRNA pseudouridine1911/1915/1917 synthase
MTETNQSLSVEGEGSGQRLDAFLARAVPELSRSQWKNLIESGRVQVNGRCCKPNHKLKTGDVLEWTVPDRAPLAAIPEDIPLNIIHEDDAIIVLNKPPGMVVHPAVGNPSGTLLHGLLFHDPKLQMLERGGIVHRLDKDTSGVMVVARTEATMQNLQNQFKARTTEKEYLAFVWGAPPKTGRIETLLGRHPVHRKKQAVLKEEGREAVSNYEVVEQFGEVALMRVHIETGRTHQIRVHMAHIGHPVAGDRVYGRARKHKLPVNPERQLLHAAKLVVDHPVSGKRLSFEAPLFDDMQSLLRELRAY